MQAVINIPEVFPDTMVTQIIAHFEAYLQKEAEHWNKYSDDTPKLDIYKSLKLKILAEYRELRQRPRREAQKNFDRLSQKIAQNLPYQSVEECLKAMRRETYDEIPA